MFSVSKVFNLKNTTAMVSASTLENHGDNSFSRNSVYSHKLRDNKLPHNNSFANQLFEENSNIKQIVRSLKIMSQL